MRISDWSSDVCSSDLCLAGGAAGEGGQICHCRLWSISYLRTMTTTTTAAAKETVRRLHGTWHGSYGKALCPAHKDRRPSLSVTPGRNAVLFHCFAGCTRSEEHTSELQSLMRISYAVFCLKKKKTQ